MPKTEEPQPKADAPHGGAETRRDHVVVAGPGQWGQQAVDHLLNRAIAIGGGWGTLSEIALALKHQIPVVTLESWSLSRPDGCLEQLVRAASSPRHAVAQALEMATPERLGRFSGR